LLRKLHIAIAGGALSFLLLGADGCLEAPGIEETWTRLDLVSPASTVPVAPGDSVSLPVRGEVVYRSILTGAVVADVRVTTDIRPSDVRLDAGAPRLELLRDVDRILAGSVSAGVATLPFAGWNHLIQDVNLTIPCSIPADPGAGGVFLLFYLADAEEVEQPSGEKILVITPFDFNTTQVLPTGVALIPEVAP
jgi:hypothetical protein